jgi:hypothetical protein
MSYHLTVIFNTGHRSCERRTSKTKYAPPAAPATSNGERKQMLEIICPKDGKVRIFPIIVSNVIVLLLWTWMIMLHVAWLVPTALIVYPTLLIVNVLIIWRASRRATNPPAKAIRVSKLAWPGVAMFTISGVVAVYYWIKEPNLRSTTQAIGAILLAGCCWFLVYRLSRGNKDQAGQ